MTHKHILLACLASAAITIGCNKPETTGQKIDRAQEKVAEAAQDMKDYTYAQKAEFVQRMEVQLRELNQELDRLAIKVEQSNARAKAENQPKLDALRGQTTRLNKQLDEVKNASESAWEEVKAGFKKGYGELKEGFSNARQWMSDKIAP